MRAVEVGAVVSTAAQPTSAAGGAVSLSDLFHAHRVSLVRLAVLLVDDDATAEDVVQDAFAGLHARRRHLQQPERAMAYLRVAVVNGARSALRRRRTARGYVPPYVAPVDSPETAALLAEEHRETLAALHRLPARQREVLVLRYWSELSVAEVAGALNISTGTVKSTTSRALAALSLLLESAS